MRRFRMFGRYKNPRKPLTADEVTARLADLEKRAAAGLVAKEVGQCQACERKQKLELDQTLTFHGYLRPGTGQTFGECLGVGFPPYELSCDRVKWMKSRAEEKLAYFRSKIAEAQSDSFESFDVETSKGWVKVDKSDADWKYRLTRHIDKLRSKARDEEMSIKHYEERIKNWELKPIASVVENERLKIAEMAARRKVKEDARAAKLAKKAELQGKRDAAVEKKRATLAEMAGRLQRAASSGDRAAALKVWDEAHAKKNEWIWDHSTPHGGTGFDEVALALGLARTNESGQVRYEHGMSKKGAEMIRQSHWRYGVPSTLEDIFNELGESMGPAVVVRDEGSETSGTARMVSGERKVTMGPKGWTVR